MCFWPIGVTTVPLASRATTADSSSCPESRSTSAIVTSCECGNQTSAVACEPATCIEIDQNDLRTLITRKPHAGMDMLAVLGKQFHTAQDLVRTRSMRNACASRDYEQKLREK